MAGGEALIRIASALDGVDAAIGFIAAAWIVLLLIVVALCRAAAMGDTHLEEER